MTEKTRNNKPYTVIIGAAVLDILGTTDRVLKAHDSTPGHIRMEAGGVGRNIAENLAWMGVRTELICILPDDSAGRLIRKQCAAAGVGLSYSFSPPGAGTSQYMAISGADGDMVMALSDVNIADHITPSALQSRHEIIEGATALVVDGNLPRTILKYLVDEFKPVPLFADPVSTSKAFNLSAILSGVHTLKMNSFEAEALSGIAVNDRHSAARAGRALIGKGVKHLYLTMQHNGIYWNREGEEGFYQQAPLIPVSSTGAGDAFMAGLVYGWEKNLSVEQTLEFASSAAVCALQHHSAVNPEVRRLADSVDGLPARLPS
ncbi:MAG: hypothetical protein B6D68_02195 [spirochete symbiont of Stewartia floridana]|nr:MAG: hypothetical protein B6D68_02195 [spirochete symbiont of Stewartia floridana]